MTNVFRRFGLCGLAAALFVGSAGAGNFDDSLRPEIVVADAASGCPSVEGAFVALLNPGRGMLLLSAAPFPGGRVIGDARGGAIDVTLPGTGTWKLDSAGSSRGQVPLWGAIYPFLAMSGHGCVGFDRRHWSSEGDLVTYLRWLVEGIYLELPAEERLRRPDFRLSDRLVSLRVERSGYGAIRLNGKEGSTLACRHADSGRVYLFMPFILDEPNGRAPRRRGPARSQTQQSQSSSRESAAQTRLIDHTRKFRISNFEFRIYRPSTLRLRFQLRRDKPTGRGENLTGRFVGQASRLPSGGSGAC